MEIRLAKTAGFCFGVNRAVELTYGLLFKGLNAIWYRVRDFICIVNVSK